MRPTRGRVIAAWIAVGYTLATFGWYVVWRGAFAERSADEGLFENILWNALHGRGLQTPVEGGLPHLAVHFSPALYLLLPLYAIAGMYGVHLAVAALMAFAGHRLHGWVARTLDDRAALPAMIAFLLCPTLVLQTFMEFHEQALAIAPLTLMLIAWWDRRLLATLVAAIALLAVREDNALVVLALGLLSLFTGRVRMAGALLALSSAWIVLWQVVARQLAGGERLPSVFAATYSAWGTTPGEVMHSVLSRPLDVVRHVLAPVPLKYLALLLAVVLGVLPFGSPLALVALPPLLLVLLADHDARQFQIRMHYSIAPSIILVFAALASLSRLPLEARGVLTKARRWAPRMMMVVALLLVPGWALKARARLNPYSAHIREVLATLPDTSSVAAPGYLLNHLAARPRLALLWRVESPGTEFVITEDSSRVFFEGTNVDAHHSPRFDSVLVAGGYSLVLERDGWHVYRRTR